MSYQRLKKWRLHRKEILVKALGGKCCICGYSKCYGALDFHHTDEDDKSFGIATMLENPTAFKNIIVEIRKCCLLCANCHREVHGKIVKLPKILPKIDELLLIDRIAKPIIHKRKCLQCGVDFETKTSGKKYCSEKCMRFGSRKSVRPEISVLLKQVNELGYTGTGKLYGVTDNAIRKWITIKK